MCGGIKVALCTTIISITEEQLLKVSNECSCNEREYLKRNVGSKNLTPCVTFSLYSRLET